MALTNLKSPIPKNLIDLLANALNKITTIAWGNITGTLSDQTDLQNALNAKEPTITTLAVTKGGTGTSTQFTQGSIPFAGASGVYSQDNTNFNYDNTNDVLNVDKIVVNDTYNSGGFPFGVVFRSTDSTYDFVFRDLAGNEIMSGLLGNLFISSNRTIRGTNSTGSVVFGSSPANGDGVTIRTIGSGVFSGNNDFYTIKPTIKSISSDTQTAVNITHSVEQNSTATGNIKGFHAEINQVLNPKRLYNCINGDSFITIIDARGTVDFNNGDTVTGTGIPPATTITSIVGSQINLSNTVTQTVNGDLVTNTSVTYTASDIPDYRALSAKVGNSVTQKAIDVREGVTPLFQVAGDGSFAFKGGTLAPAQTGWTISNPVTKRTIDVSTATLGDLREIVGTLLQDLINKGIIKP